MAGISAPWLLTCCLRPKEMSKSWGKHGSSHPCLLKVPFLSFLFYLFLVVLGLCCCVGFSLDTGKQGPLSSCRVWASHCDGFSCYGAQALGPSGFSSCGARAHSLQLQSTGSIVVVHGLSFSTAGEIFLDQGLSLCLLHWQADSLPLSHKGSPQGSLSEF